MYKALALIVSAFVLIYIYSDNNQEKDVIRITYSKNIEKRTDTIGSIPYKDEIKKLKYLLDLNSKDLFYELTILDFHSEFKENKVLISDEKNKIFKKLASTIGGTKGVFYINKKDSVFINKLVFDNQEYRIKMEVGKWQISKETRKINNYICYKATKIETIDNSNIDNQRKVVAWFCPSLPSFYGPAGYFGLPGTILEVSNGQITLHATKIKFEKETKEKIEVPNEGELLSKKEYEAIIRKIAQERFDFDFKN